MEYNTRIKIKVTVRGIIKKDGKRKITKRLSKRENYKKRS